MRYRLGKTGIAPLIILMSTQAVFAQVNADMAGNQKFSDAAAKLESSKGQLADAGMDVKGIQASPGILFLPAAFVEAGYDTNPNLLLQASGSAFFRTGVSAILTKTTPDTVASLRAAGSWLTYVEGVERSQRLSGAIEGNIAHQLMPGITISANGLFDHDGQSTIPSQTAAVSTQLSYQNQFLTSFARTRFIDLQYSNDPFEAATVFNAQRAEVSSGVLVANQSWLGVYTEWSAAGVFYTDQPRPLLVNRNTEDYYTKAGARITLSPSFTADVGWRFNWRDLDDAAIHSFNSSYFDANITWNPAPYFLGVASIERTIGEPSSAFGLLADIRSYDLKATYLPFGGVAVTLRGARQAVNEIGADYRYHVNLFDSEVAYDFSTRIQLYTAFHYTYYDVDRTNLNYDRFITMVGMRIVPDGKNLLNGRSADDLLERLNTIRLPDAEVTVSSGYSFFALPDLKMTTIIGGPFFDQAVGQQTNGDGGFSGVRTDARAAKLAEYTLPDGRWLSFGLAGFYATYGNSVASHCRFTGVSDCAFVNLVDFNPQQENNTGAFGDLHTVTNRDLNYYGISVDARIGDVIQGSFKDAGPLRELSPLKVGLAMRTLMEFSKLNSQDPLVPDSVHYNDQVDTHYWGGFIGFEKNMPIAPFWWFNIDATAGLYYTDTQFCGHYSGYVFDVFNGYVGETGNLTLNTTNTSFIGTIRLALSRDIGRATFGVFGQAEYLSYVPGIMYNNNDQAGGSPFGIRGTQVGTHIMSDDSFNYTTGLSLAFKL
jgi:hypothetical protein